MALGTAQRPLHSARWGHIFDDDSEEDFGSEEDDRVRKAKFNSLGTLVFDVWEHAKRCRDECERDLTRVYRRSTCEHQAWLGVFVIDYSDDNTDSDE